MKHPLVKLAHLIDWSVFEREWAGHFPSKKGRPASSGRLVAGLFYLQHTFNCSDEMLYRPLPTGFLKIVLYSRPTIYWLLFKFF